jgi:hypothetical protein
MIQCAEFTTMPYLRGMVRCDLPHGHDGAHRGHGLCDGDPGDPCLRHHSIRTMHSYISWVQPRARMM